MGDWYKVLLILVMMGIFRYQKKETKENQEARESSSCRPSRATTSRQLEQISEQKMVDAPEIIDLSETHLPVTIPLSASAPSQSHRQSSKVLESVKSAPVLIQDSTLQSQSNNLEFPKPSSAGSNLLDQFMANHGANIDHDFKV